MKKHKKLHNLLEITKKGYDARLRLALMTLGQKGKSLELSIAIFWILCEFRPICEWENELRDTIASEGEGMNKDEQTINKAMQIGGIS